MTYNVFGGTLNLAQLQLRAIFTELFTELMKLYHSISERV